MALEQKTKVIGDYTYTVTQLGAKKGSQVYLRLIKAIGPGFSAGSLAEGIGEILKGLNWEDVEFLQNAFAEFSTATDSSMKVSVLGRAEVFDTHFAGRYEDLTRWMIFCVEVNFQSFFDKIRAAMAGGGAEEVLKSA